MSGDSDPDPQMRSPPTFLRRNLSRVPLLSRIPNPSVRMMFRDKEAGTRSRVPGWAGYYDHYYRSSTPDETTSEWTLPFLTNADLPPDFIPGRGYHILTGAGGLVLVRCFFRPTDPLPIQQPEPATIQQTGPAAKVAGRRRGRPKPRPRKTDTAKSDASRSSTSQHDGCSCCTSWEPLLVCNPLTLERRGLPRLTAASVGVESWDYHGVQAAMVAHGNSYKVILTFRTCLCVYNSTSHSWRFFQFPKPAVWGRDRIFDQENNKICSPWGWVSPHACVNGRLYFADVVSETPANYELRLFEVDYDLGTWTLQNSFTLRKRHWSFLQSTDPRREMDDIRSVELVECGGELYAVIPARIDEHLTSEFTSVRTLEELLRDHVPGLEILPIQFHILRLQGGEDEDRDGFAHRIQRIVLPQALRNLESRKEDLVENFRDVYGQKLANWFRNMFWCAADGSVIFLACEDYFMQYDVVTGESTTGIVGDSMLMSVPHNSFSPNAHMKP